MLSLGYLTPVTWEMHRISFSRKRKKWFYVTLLRLKEERFSRKSLILSGESQGAAPYSCPTQNCSVLSHLFSNQEF